MLQNFLVIVNPKSGKGAGQKALAQLQAAASAKGAQLEVMQTEYAGHAVTFLQQHSLEHIQAVISIGGDGTLNEVLNGLLTREDHPQLPIGIIPSGTGNSLMHDLNCPHAEAAIQDIFSGKNQAMDIFEIELDGSKKYGFNMLGCGLPASINDCAETLRLFKKQRYNIAALQAISHYTPTGHTLTHTASGKEFKSDFIIASNTRHIGSGLKIAPEALLDDGLLDVVMLKPFSRLSLFPLFYKLFKGTHLADKKVIVERMNAFKIQAPHRVLLNIDGEQHEFTELQLRVLPQRITLLHQPPSIK